MPLQFGYLDNNGHPRLKIHVSGSSPGASLEVDALIDTGFTGFLMLPIAQAIPLGMTLLGTGDYTLANGTKITNFLAEGTITLKASTPPVGMPALPPGTIADESAKGIIVLAGTGAIVGMEFLRTFDKLFIVGKVVMLVSQTLLAGVLPTTPTQPPQPSA